MRIILLVSLLFQFASCEAKKNDGLTIHDSTKNVSETIDGNSLDSYSNYLYLNSISNGNSWYDDENKQDQFYRVLVSSIGEESYIDVELIQIGEEGNLRLISRNKVDYIAFGIEYYPLNTKIISWESPKVVKIKIGKDIYHLDFDSMTGKRL